MTLLCFPLSFLLYLFCHRSYQKELLKFPIYSSILCFVLNFSSSSSSHPQTYFPLLPLYLPDFFFLHLLTKKAFHNSCTCFYLIQTIFSQANQYLISVPNWINLLCFTATETVHYLLLLDSAFLDFPPISFYYSSSQGISSGLGFILLVTVQNQHTLICKGFQFYKLFWLETWVCFRCKKY